MGRTPENPEKRKVLSEDLRDSYPPYCSTAWGPAQVPGSHDGSAQLFHGAKNHHHCWQRRRACALSHGKLCTADSGRRFYGCNLYSFCFDFFD